MRDTIIVTGGAGFVGSNLIRCFLKKTKYKIISLDNYSSGSKKNHIQNNRVRYLKGSTSDIKLILNKKKKSINSILENLMNVISLIQLDQKQFLNFV